MSDHRSNQDQPNNAEPPPGTLWSLHSALHMVGAVRDFWSSDLNRAAIDLLNPQPGQTLLDLGAGFGPATIAAAKRVAPDGRVIAVDPSRAMRRILGLRRLWQRTRRVIDVRTGAAEELPIAASSIDAAWAINAAHHFDDLERATTELARVLKPGGRLLVVEEDLTSAKHPYYHGTLNHGHGPETIDPQHTGELLTATGLNVTGSDHGSISGDPATVITATKPKDHPESRDSGGVERASGLP